MSQQGERDRGVSRDDDMVRLKGDLVFQTVPAIWRAQKDLFSTGAAVTVDLDGVGRVDSSALALLLGWVRLARAAKKNLSFAHIPESLWAIARVTGVEEILRDPLADGGSD